MQNTRTKKAFTLIELLIVIAIIGILAVSLLPSILDAPASARDAARKAALNDVITAIESYRATNGVVPAIPSSTPVCLNDSAAPGTDIETYLKGQDIEQLYSSKSISQAIASTCVTPTAPDKTSGISYFVSGTTYTVCVGTEKTGKSGSGFYSDATAATAGDTNIFCIKN